MVAGSRGAAVVHDVQPGVHVVEITLPGWTEYHITAVPLPGESLAGVLARSRAKAASLDASIICQEILGRERASGGDAVPWPVTYIGGGGDGGVQTTALRGVPVQALEVDGRVVGVTWQEAAARYCRLGGLAAIGATHPDAAAQSFLTLNHMLNAVDMDFTHVVRTWFYLHKILDWYGDFNHVRHAFFQEHGVYDSLIPASTGMGCQALAGESLAGGLLAMKPTDGRARAIALDSPLQGPATAYGSSFSRANEIQTDTARRVYVSGTASIDPDGNTVHLGDTQKQVALTVDVVGAILESRGMSWQHVTRAIAYFKRDGEYHHLAAYCDAQSLPPFPVVYLQNDVCRDNLLFELEVDAVLPL